MKLQKEEQIKSKTKKKAIIKIKAVNRKIEKMFNLEKIKNNEMKNKIKQNNV